MTSSTRDDHATTTTASTSSDSSAMGTGVDVLAVVRGELYDHLHTLCGELRVTLLITDSAQVARHWWGDARRVVLDEDGAAAMHAEGLAPRDGVTVLCPGMPAAGAPVHSTARAIGADHVVAWLPDARHWLRDQLDPS